MDKKKFPLYKVLFFLIMFSVGLGSSIFVFVFFVFPATPISEFAAISALPAKYLLILLLGGFSRDFFLGWAATYSYYRWKGKVVG